MFPYKTSFVINRESNQALYLQLANQFIQFITDGKLPSETKLVGSRTLSELLNVHRKTVVACYQELQLQGWVESIPKKGTFVNANLPILQQRNFFQENKKTALNTGFNFYTNQILGEVFKQPNEEWMYINDGISDARLTPTDEIARIYRRIAGRKSIFKHLSYGSTYGNDTLRQVLAEYLNKTRGLNISVDNILITRGSQMGIYISAQLLLNENEIIIIGETNYASATITFQHQRATIFTVKVDNDGIDTKQVEKICKKQRVKALYVTSHHHHPTTVTLSAERRIHLLNLAKKYNFAIIEDDYDYDFNYNQAPILPLASHDVNGNVIYIGSVCKTVAPVFRIGYLIASKLFVDEASKLRKFIDRQGDALLELTFAEFVRSGSLDAHIRKVLKIYKRRRDLFCELLEKECGNVFSFEIPKGGMAVWITLDKKYTWKQVAETAKKQQLKIGDWERYDMFSIKHNAIRIGFAKHNKEELIALVVKLKNTMLGLKS